ncbi:MAG TPA: DUF3467 domain-containing protein [Terriglobales bacterium]|nr:DUF3467 domain-containing protein [Terriglobales bacterium]
MPTDQGVAMPNPENPSETVIYIDAADFKLLYTNFVQSIFSPLDVALSIGEVLGPGPDGRMRVLNKARLSMSPAEAKILHVILGNTIKNYEARFGEIVVPQGLMPPSA